MATNVQDKNVKPGPVEKRCRNCGIDVSKKKRAKDRAGNYLCQPCYEAAKSKVIAKSKGDLEKTGPSSPVMDNPSANSPPVESANTSSAPVRSFKWKRLAIISGVSAVGIITVVVTSGVLINNSTWNDVDNANKKISATDQELIQNAERQRDAVATPPTNSAVPNGRPSRSEIVDSDSTLSDIASRSADLDSALRGTCSAAVGDSALRLAWHSDVISYEEYQYAQKFRQSQGDVP